MDILGLGMSLLDTVHVVDEFPAGSGVTEIRESAIMGGGPVPTALCAAAQLGARAGIIDRIGDDWRGHLIAEDYRKFGVDLKNLAKVSGGQSSFGLVFVRKQDGERHLVFEQGNVTPIVANELPKDELSKCRILHLNGRHWPACIEAAQIVRESGGLVSFDGGANRYEAKFLELLPLVDLL
ncbi:MAG: PfkB family carbohydrate kinase, partial [Verrucomicrobiota bacterium]